MRERRAFHGVVIGPDRFEHAQAVLVDVDAGAGRAQPVGALMHAHAPAALRQRAGRGQAGKSGADDFGVTLAHDGVMPKLPCSRHRSGAKGWLFEAAAV